MTEEDLTWRRRLFRRPVRKLCFVGLFAFIGLNVLAWSHARSATHLDAGEAPRLEIGELGLSTKVRLLFTGAPMNKPRCWREPPEVGLDHEVLHVETEDGLTLEVWRIPHDQPTEVVCLFHGYVGTKSSLLDEARFFHDRGAEAWLVDFRASGGSEGHVTSIGWYEALDVAAVVREARARTNLVPILFGRSMGAVACMRAVAGGEVSAKALILESPFEDMLSTIENRFAIVGVPAFPSAHLMTFWGGVQLGFDAFEHRPVEYARSITVPVLLQYGGVDLRVPRAESEAIAAALADVRECVFEETGHVRLEGSDPETWRASVGEFLLELED